MIKTTYLIEIEVQWDFTFAKWTYRKEYDTLKEAYNDKLSFWEMDNEHIIEKFINQENDNDELRNIYRKRGFWPVKSLGIGQIIERKIEEKALTYKEIQDIIKS